MSFKLCSCCKEKNNPTFDRCWKCGSLIEGKPPFSHRESWTDIVMNMTSGFETARSKFFDSCVETIQEASSNPDKPYKIEIKNTRLEGAADCAIKTYQLYLASGFIAQHEYVALNEGKDFADILYTSVCRKDLRECLNYLNRCLEKEKGEQLNRFCSDVAKHITRSDATLFESLLIARLCPWLATVVHILVAAAFGDQETVKKLGEDAKKRFQR